MGRSATRSGKELSGVEAAMRSLAMSGYAVPLNCSYCGKAMTQLRSQGHWHFYQCERCGPITLPPNGQIRRTNPSDYCIEPNSQENSHQ